MTSLLVDTNVFVEHIRRRRLLRAGRDRLSYSVITRAELFAGGLDAVVRGYLDPFTELEVTRSIAERAGRLMRDRRIPVGDALIAATALDHELVLLTRNVRDFEDIPKLRVRQPA